MATFDGFGDAVAVVSANAADPVPSERATTVATNTFFIIIPPIILLQDE
jgi:hypothetical protein